jgi:glucoamylase
MNLEDWIARQRRHVALMMRQSISSSVVKGRPRFFQTIVPKPGSVVASPVLASYDPEPDYFFHWYRDSAVVIDALRLVTDEVPEAHALFDDFVTFSLGLESLDGRIAPPPQAEPEFTRFLRKDLSAAHGQAIGAETRVNPDGTLDITDWPRPQHDGPALRALTIMRWGVPGEDAMRLLRADLAFVLRHAREPCFGVWEEEKGLHYYVLRVSAAALETGADWLMAQGDTEFAAQCRETAAAIFQDLESWWLPEEGFIRAHLLAPPRAGKELDVSVILAANHAHASPDEKLMATLARLEELFYALYPINWERAAPAIGRYAGDRYYGGGAWYAATLAAAEFYYRHGDMARGDLYMETVRAFTPESGDMSEQFDRETGAQTSARHLAWSYAAFITAAAERRRAASV